MLSGIVDGDSRRVPPARAVTDFSHSRNEAISNNQFMTRELLSAAAVVAVAALIAVWLSAESRAQTRPSLAGAWMLNKDLSDPPPDRDDRSGDAGGRRGGGYGRGGGVGRGRMGRGGAGGSAIDRDAMARMRDAMRDIMEPSERLTITETGTMIVITTAEGHTTRLSPDGSRITDDNTKIERRTHWDGDKLVSEITGVGRGKIRQTYALDPERHQLRIVASLEGGRDGRTRTVTHVYDAQGSNQYSGI
jgi:hypothetical protein